MMSDHKPSPERLPAGGRASSRPRLHTHLVRLIAGENLTREEAAEFLESLLDPNASDAQIAAALIALTVKGETPEELAGMASAMRLRAGRLATSGGRFVDTAGTGSSAAKTFNVSTASAFVIAGAGLPVAKHGNRAATSRSGGADVLTSLGVRVDAPPEVSEMCLRQIGICFMFAPTFHKATARVAAVRRQLGVRTTFNLLGPLTNPAGAPFQLLGVWHPSLVRRMSDALALLGTERAWVVHGADGLDEITLADKTSVAEVRPEGVNLFQVEPKDFGYSYAPLGHLCGGDAHDNARIITDVLIGKRKDEARALVVVNAAAALFLGGAVATLHEAARLAEHSIDSGSARIKLDQLVEATNSTGHVLSQADSGD